MPEEDLVLTKTLSERIKYVRDNLVDATTGDDITQPAFANLLGVANGHHGVMAWEKRGREPRAATRKRLAALTGYREAVFSRAEAEEIVVERAVPRLRDIEEALNALGPRLERQVGTLARRVRALERQEQPRTGPASDGAA